MLRNTVANHLPLARPLAPSAFPPASATSLVAGPDEPLVGKYTSELATLLLRDPTLLAPDEAQWRQQQLARAVDGIRDEVELVRSAPGGFGSM